MTSEFGYRADDTHPLSIRLLREVAAFAFFLLFSIVMLWPLARHLDTAVPDLGDPLLNTWILDWDLYSITNAPLHIYDANIFYPSKYPLAYSENLFGIAIVALPFYLLGFTPLAVYNIAVLLGFAFCGYGAYVLGRTLTRSAAAGIVAGILYAFVNFRLDHLSHLQFVWGGWMPMMLAALLHYWRRPTIRNAILYGLCVLMNGLTNIHQFLFGTTALVLSVALIALLTTRFKWRTLIGAAAATIVAAALMVPVLLPYKQVSETYGMVRDRNTAMWGSAYWTDWLSATGRSRAYGAIPDPANVRGEGVLFPGLMMLFLTGSALLIDRRKLPVALDARPVPRWLLHLLDALIVAMAIGAYIGAATKNYQWKLLGHTIISFQTTSKPASSDVPMVILIVAIIARFALQLPKGLSGDTMQSLRTAAARSRIPIEIWVMLLWIILGVLGSLGLHAFVHTFLYDRLTMFRSMRVPARWATVAYVGLAGASACGAAAWIERRRTTIARWAIAALLIALSIHDVLPIIRWEHALEITDPAYVWMRDTKISGGTLEMPVSEGIAQFLYQFGATIHHKPLMNGTSGFEPPLHAKIVEMTGRKKLPDELLPLLARNDCHFLLVHDDWLRGASEPTHIWLARELALGRIGFVRRFDHRGGGDYIFAVASNVPNWRDLRPPEKGDGAGFTEEQEMQRALRAEPTYMSHAFGIVDTPRSDDTIKGPLTVTGWALSPNGVAAVDVLLHNGTQRFRATPTVRLDVKARFPWYPQEKHGGFTVTFPKRPKGVPQWTDAQVEIIDTRGKRTRLPDIVLNWP
ncbi:MAG: hypothetical protein QOK37_3370 [Thermoanaerobaculia bacterium]|jgi:hypothetical protein|nr:hypothetical protein [Thermoanaerobaculia bacterium]